MDDYDDPSWQPLPPTSLPQRTARHLTTSIPSVRVIESANNQAYAAPHPDFAAFDHNIYQPSAQAQEPQAPPLNLLTDFQDFVNPAYHQNNIMGNTQPPEVSSTLTLQKVPRHERTQSLNSNNMPTPVSMAGPRSPLLSPANDRRPSTSSSMGPLHQLSHSHSRQQSEDISSQEDDGETRRNHAFKRAEEPPKNPEGKMMCKHQDCTSLTFDRKCEWR